MQAIFPSTTSVAIHVPNECRALRGRSVFTPRAANAVFFMRAGSVAVDRFAPCRSLDGGRLTRAPVVGVVLRATTPVAVVRAACVRGVVVAVAANILAEGRTGCVITGKRAHFIDNASTKRRADLCLAPPTDVYFSRSMGKVIGCVSTPTLPAGWGEGLARKQNESISTKGVEFHQTKKSCRQRPGRRRLKRQCPNASVHTYFLHATSPCMLR